MALDHGWMSLLLRNRSPAPEVAGYSCKARLRGLDVAIPDYVLKNHTPQAPEAKPACAG